MKYYIINFLAFLTLFTGLLSFIVSAHGIGGGQDKTMGKYLIDFGYNEFEPTEQEPIFLTFELKDSDSKEPIKFKRLWTMISDQEDNLLFKDGIDQKFEGEAALKYIFPHQGSYTIRLQFQNNTATIAEIEFSLDIAPKYIQHSSKSYIVNEQQDVISIKNQRNGMFSGYLFPFISKMHNTISSQVRTLLGFFKNNNLDRTNILTTSLSAEDVSIKEKVIQIKEACGNESHSLGKLTCYSKEFQDIAFENGPDFAFEVLNSLKKLDETAKVCHLIAHGIGWGTYERNPDDWQNHIATINPTCVYGGLHGILEQYIYDLPGGKLTKEVITDICKSNPKPGCVHAVGHLTTVETQDDLDAAIELCSAFPQARRERHYCLTGVFMERMIADNLVQHGIYPQSRRKNWYKLIDEFEELCRSYKGENATACWTEIVHASSIKFLGDPEKIFNHCNSAQVEEGAKRCRRHAITEILSKNDYNLTSLKYICSIKQINDSTFERDCYTNLASLKLFHSALNEAIDVVEFCSSLDSEFQSSCFQQIGSTLNKLAMSKDDI